MKYNYQEIDDMTIEQIETRLRALDEEVRSMDKVSDVNDATEYKRNLLERKEEIRDYQERKATERSLNGGYNPNPGSISSVVARENYNTKETRGFNMENSVNELEIRALQKFITGGYKNLTDVEQRALNTTGAAAVMPIQIMNKLITSEKYSDLLYRATVINEGGAAKIYVPIASNTAASWKLENSDVDGSSTSYEATPTLTKLELGGRELYRWSRISAAAHSMSTGDFTDLMLQLLSTEVVETLEKAFIDGGGTTEPKGLENLTWTTGTNQILTASSATPIAPVHIAEAISLLSQKYARNAIVLVNADTLYNISMFKGTAEYAYPMQEAATKFMGKEIIVTEHMDDDEVFIVDPKELYVRFASPIAVEANYSSGFTAASIDLRALTVVDSVWNPSACVRVGLGA